MESSSLCLILCVVLFSIFNATAAQDICTGKGTCNDSNGNYTSTSAYNKNLKKLMSIISSNSQIDYGFYNFSVGQNRDKVYGIGVCRGDQSLSSCRNCLNNAKTRLLEDCPTQKEAIIYIDWGVCMLRYSDKSIFGVVEDSPSCSWFNHNAYKATEKFNQTLASLLSGLTNDAAAGNSRHKYASGGVDVPGSTIKVYGLTQCNPDLSSSNCSACLQRAITQLLHFPAKGGVIIGPSCSVEFEDYMFYNYVSWTSPDTTTSSVPGKRRRTYKIFIIVGVLFLVLMQLASLSFYFMRRIRKMQRELASKDQMKCVDSLQSDFKTIQVATDHFSDAKLLYNGSSSTFYKGTLPCGQEVAVKRLCKSGRDGELEFDNEVLLLANLQHRNLVKLLGFCSKKDLRLLMYEFQPNESLERFIYDPVKRSHLDWEMRYKIILGITRGLLYLHEDSQMRVIHRDLKASHILLGVDMNPRISNFSKARLIHADQPMGGTSTIKGTSGYMAPEYVLQGHFSIKSDVFSFGVLLLEIISGQNISSFSDGENEENLLSFAWSKWSEGKASDVIDQAMPSTGSHTAHILRCIEVALICVQEAPACRPTMSGVAFMLNSNILLTEELSRPALIICA